MVTPGGLVEDSRWSAGRPDVMVRSIVVVVNPRWWWGSRGGRMEEAEATRERGSGGMAREGGIEGVEIREEGGIEGVRREGRDSTEEEGTGVVRSSVAGEGVRRVLVGVVGVVGSFMGRRGDVEEGSG